MRPAIVSGIVTGNTPVNYWPIVTAPDSVFARVNSSQFPSRSQDVEWNTQYNLDFSLKLGRNQLPASHGRSWRRPR